jgi:hypothetical protein
MEKHSLYKFVLKIMQSLSQRRDDATNDSRLQSGFRGAFAAWRDIKKCLPSQADVRMQRFDFITYLFSGRITISLPPTCAAR